MTNTRVGGRIGCPRRTRKLARLRERLRDPEWRRYGYLLLAGKALGIAFLLGGDLRCCSNV